MTNESPIRLDVAVVGGGPAGMSACLELSKSSELNIALFESESELGAIPRTCHFFFGLRDRKRIYTGPTYAHKLTDLIRKTSVKIHADTTVIKLIPASSNKALHRIHVSSPYGIRCYESRFLILATGCFENSRSARVIPGSRPAGILTTGTLQQLVNLHHLKPGKRAIVIGSEHVAFSNMLTLRRAGTSVAAMVEDDVELQSYSVPAKAMSTFFGFTIYGGTSVKAILGHERVEGVELIRGKDRNSFKVECDTVVITGKFRPDSALIDDTPIQKDPSTLGPAVDMNLMTSIPNLFAAGNVLRGAHMGDLCALEGKLVGQNILTILKSGETRMEEGVPIRAEPPIRYVVPQKVEPSKLHAKRNPFSCLGFAIQVERTLRKSVIEARAGNEIVWRRFCRKLIANTRIPLPVDRFNWRRVDPQKGITLRVSN